jgi:hypothetical protein
MQIKKYILKIVGLLLVLFLLDTVIGYFLNKYYFAQTHGESAVLTSTIDNPTSQKGDLLIFGSSKAKRNYNPQILSDSLLITCYNAGYDGLGILYSNALFDIIIDKYEPRIVILDIISDELDYLSLSYDQLAVLNPYAKKYPVLWKTLLLKSPFEKIKHISKIYPHNSSLNKIVMDKWKKQSEEININGYTPKCGIWNEPLQSVSLSDTQLDQNKINAFNAFLEKCVQRKLKVYIVFSPEYRKFENDTRSITYIKEKCKALNIEFITYQNNENFFNNQFFRDVRHLNNFGADAFSSDISSVLIKQLLVK